MTAGRVPFHRFFFIVDSDDILRAACRAYEARADALDLGVGGSVRRCWIEGDIVVVESLCEQFYYKIFGQELVAAALPAK